MPDFRKLLTSLLLIVVVCSCNKDKKEAGCNPGAPIIRTILNKTATIKVGATNDPVYLIEQGSIDTRLIPCNFPMEFYENNLQVTISGEVKSYPQTGTTPCCTESIFITKITR